MSTAAFFIAGAGTTSAPHPVLLKQMMIHFLAFTCLSAKGAATDPVPCVLGMDGGIPSLFLLGTRRTWAGLGVVRAQTLYLARLGSNSYLHFLAGELGKSLKAVCALVFSAVGWAEGTVPLSLEVTM